MNMAPQTYANHTRWHPPFHFFVMPVMIVNFFWSIMVFVRAPDKNSGWGIVVSLALVVLAFIARTNALKTQDRIIRLEEKLRYQQVLSPALLQRCNTLTLGQIIALRFAPDEELEEVVSAVVDTKLVTSAQIKQAIKNWRSDDSRV